MRIAMLLHKSVEHDSRVRREARALAEDGHEVTVLHLPREPGEFDGPLDGYRVRSVTPPPWVRRRLPASLYRPLFLLGFVRALRAARPDAVHAHDVAMLAPGAIGAALTGARLVYDSHEYAAGVPYRERGWALFVTTLQRLLIRRCDAVITVSDGIADRLRDDHQLDRRPAVVRNVPDPEAYDAAFRAPDLRATLGVSAGAPLIVHLGAAAIDRGCDALVRALAHMPDAHLVFLGADDAGYVEGLRSIAAEADVDDRVHFHPSVPIAHVRSYAEQADVGVSLLDDSCENHRLALPNKVFEYLAAGVPVVASDLPELRRLFVTHRIGALADPRSPADVARAIGAVLGAREGGELAPELDRAREALSWERERRALLDAYESIEPVRESSPGALLLVRNTCRHDARVLRAAGVLGEAGFRTAVLAVVSSTDRERRTRVEGVAVNRLAPGSPFATLRRASARLSPAPAGGASVAAASTTTAAPGVLTRLNRLLVTADFYRRALGAIGRERPALLHCNDYNTVWPGVIARVLWKIPLVYDSHELWADRNGRTERRWWLLACEALFTRVADELVTTSPGHADVLAGRYRVRRPWVVRNIPAAAAGGPAAARERAPGPSASPLGVYVGAVTTSRGLEQAIAALAHEPAVRLRIVGPDSRGFSRHLRDVATRLGVADRVDLAGPVAPGDVVAELRDADFGLALIQPSCLSYEMCLPNKLFEYLGVGVPVLASDIPVLAASVSEWGVGITCEPDGPQAIAAAMAAIAEPTANAELRARAVAAGSTVTWRAERERLRGVYRSALARSGRR